MKFTSLLMQDSSPKISFGMIVLNGEPFTRYLLRQIYPFAHEILVVEGAVPAAAAVATPEGHSNDDTLEAIREFQRKEDPEHKVVLVTAEDEGRPNGFWTGEKDEMSQAYARRATGNYLWQVDSDEFYRAADLERVITMLREEPEISAVTFKMLTFWGGFDYVTDGWYLRRGAGYYNRLFRWGPGFHYSSHRPPTVLDADGRDTRSLRWVTGKEMALRGVMLYHYSLLFPKQVREKCAYYASAEWAARSGAERWAKDTFLALKEPFHVHNVYEYPSWLERFSGEHPEQIQAMRRDIESGRLAIEMRGTDDIERLLRSPAYALGREWLKAKDQLERLPARVRSAGKRLLHARRR